MIHIRMGGVKIFEQFIDYDNIIYIYIVFFFYGIAIDSSTIVTTTSPRPHRRIGFLWGKSPTCPYFGLVNCCNSASYVDVS